MNEIARGIYHWQTFHEGIQANVSSYYVEPAATVLDPTTPDDGLELFAARNVERVVLTNRHHYRHADRFAARFDVPVYVVEQGEHELKGRPGLRTFAFGDEVGPGITSHPIDPSWPDEGALHFALGTGLLAIGDGAIRYDKEIGFVPDRYLGTDPDRVKPLLRAGYGRLLSLDFDTLLFAHGEPLVGGGKEALRAFTEGGA